MHKVQPGQQVRIITLELAVPADAPEDQFTGEIWSLLSENGVFVPESFILDWRYLNKYGCLVQTSAAPEECEVFLYVENDQPRTLYLVRHQEAGTDGGALSDPLLVTWDEDAAYTLAAAKLKEVLEGEEDEEDELPDNFDGLYQLWKAINEGSPYGLESYWVEAITVPAH